MTTPLLVVTLDPDYWGLIRQNLEKTGSYRVFIANTTEAAVSYLQEEAPSLVLLDTDFKAANALELGQILREIHPNIQFVVISDDNRHPALEELAPRGYLPKPFYLPDLLEILGKELTTATNNPEQKKQEEHPKRSSLDGDLPWLEDVNRAAQHLTRLTLESSAQAALITRNKAMWAYAGQLPQAAARELVDTVSRYWDPKSASDLIRFIRLTTTNAEHMLYATHLADGMVLAIVFDAETSFTTIRSQAGNLVRSLSVSPSDVINAPSHPEEDADPDLTPLVDILGVVPPPNPRQSTEAVEADFFKDAAEIQMPSRKLVTFSRASSPAIPQKPVNYKDRSGLLAEEEKEEYLPETQVETRKNVTLKKKSVPDELDDTHPNSVPEVSRHIVLEPTTHSVYNLTYICLLIPRFTNHYLTGDLAGSLSEWVPQISIAYGWRLEYISIRPDYLQWIENVPPATSPSYMMRIFRQNTSERIFADFPRFKKENPSGDFWAPGYLIMGGSQPLPAQLIKDFIQQTRQRQGLLPPYQLK